MQSIICQSSLIRLLFKFGLFLRVVANNFETYYKFTHRTDYFIKNADRTKVLLVCYKLTVSERTNSILYFN